ncbi:unnamed protein product [marine sediment metagenome]|uniref:Uncharacterized protein n=1 Tax=marine sediment metagenome TaxID=412755 RepID=X1HBQ2_9ZZZZ
MSQLICPLCGKFVSVRYYEPEDFEDDIKRVQVRGKGRGKGTEREWTVSVFDDGDDPLFFKLRDRISKLYFLFFDDEDMSDEEEELLDDINTALKLYYEYPFDNLIGAALALLAQFRDHEEEEDDDEDDVVSEDDDEDEEVESEESEDEDDE